MVANVACTPLGRPETENYTEKFVLPLEEVMLSPASVFALPPCANDSSELFKLTEKLAKGCTWSVNGEEWVSAPLDADTVTLKLPVEVLEVAEN